METLSSFEVDSLPAGGSDPNRFDPKEAWYPVHYVEYLDKSKPTPFTLLGRDIVIWWDSTGSCWRVFEDKCPHRLAPLSEGRIAEDGLLECPYHGWAFSGEGECDRIPQQVEDLAAQASNRACVTSLPAIERQGLLFAYPGLPENASLTPVPIVEPMEESLGEWVCVDTFRDLPYDAITLLENVIDSSHIPYTHHGSVGNRAFAGPVELEVIESGKQGFKGAWESGPRLGTLGRQETTFIAPCLMWHDLISKQFGRTLTVVYATPIRKGSCRIFARFPFKFPFRVPGWFMKLVPHWLSHIGQHAVLEDDQIFLHHQERILSESGGSANFAKAFYLPTLADRYVIELRSWVNNYGGDPFPGATLPPTLPRERLLNRYYSHTLKCSSCSKALANIRRVRMGCAVVAAIAWVSTPILAVCLNQTAILAVALSTAASVALFAAWGGLGKLERQFYEGWDVPLRNLPQSGAAAVAAGLSPLELGGDGGGSIRLPSHFCGVFGLKPTEHRVSLAGLVLGLPGGSRGWRYLTVAGPLARSVEDLRLCLSLIEGSDNREWEVPPAPVENATQRPLSQYRFAFSDEFGGVPVTGETREAIKKLAVTLEQMGCRVEYRNPPNFNFVEALLTYGEIAGAESVAAVSGLERLRWRILSLVPSGVVNAGPVAHGFARGGALNMRWYTEALTRRDALIGAMQEFLSDWDAWICPVAAGSAFTHRQMMSILGSPLEVDNQKLPYWVWGISYTAVFNLTGNPVVAMPFGQTKEGLPIGVQVVGRRWRDMELLSVAHKLTEVTGVCQRPPGY